MHLLHNTVEATHGDRNVLLPLHHDVTHNCKRAKLVAPELLVSIQRKFHDLLESSPAAKVSASAQ